MRQLEFPENIQAIVGGKEYSLDNAVLKIWPESEETKGALCVEMEGVGLFTIANYRKCVATGIYVVSDVYSENDWKLGWEGNDIKRAVGAVIDMIIESTVLRGELAEQQSIFIMRTFREMRHYIKQNQQFVTRSEMELLSSKVTEISVQTTGLIDKQKQTDQKVNLIQKNVEQLSENFISEKDVKN